MPTMIPPYPRANANRSEKAIFTALEGIMDRPDWIVIHSLELAQNYGALMGEADFVVLAPGKGILVIEAKSPNFVEYKAGDWYLDKTPSPTKSPLKQLDGARRSIRGFLGKRDLLSEEPIARLLWFTSISRHQFENKTPGDMQFFEWELGWHDDTSKPTWLIEKALDEHFAHFSGSIDMNREAFTADRAKAIADALVGDFKGMQTKADVQRDLRIHERKLLDEQVALLDLVETNPHVYFDGSAGTGKSFLLAEAARRLDKRGKRTLVTCWNLLMADELRLMTSRPGIDVADLNSIMLSVSGLTSNPTDADNTWFQTTLPELAIAALAEKPYLGGYEAVCVDEFQDIAGNPLLLKVVLAFAGTGSATNTEIILAGDESQQILRPNGERVSALAEARKLMPDLAHLRLRTNCRTAPGLSKQLQRALKLDLQLTGHRIPSSVESGLDVVAVTPGEETAALAAALRSLLTRFAPEDIRVLSPFGSSSVAATFDDSTADGRWLRKQFVPQGKIGWRSIFKFKGLEADAVIITDLNPGAVETMRQRELDLGDLLYVGMTRAKYQCVVLDSAAYLGS
jgi:hypothetical protein